MDKITDNVDTDIFRKQYKKALAAAVMRERRLNDVRKMLNRSKYKQPPDTATSFPAPS